MICYRKETVIHGWTTKPNGKVHQTTVRFVDKQVHIRVDELTKTVTIASAFVGSGNLDYKYYDGVLYELFLHYVNTEKNNSSLDEG